MICCNTRNLLEFKHEIYPPELDITTDDESNQHVHYLDLDILIKNNRFSYCIYDKRQIQISNCKSSQFTPIVCFFHNSLDMLGVVFYFEDFQKRTNSLIVKLLQQNFRLHRLEKVYKKFCSS